jgi:glyoxylase-like metal-dependent hydrolase (beta-lactamase superfamily II)
MKRLLPLLLLLGIACAHRRTDIVMFRATGTLTAREQAADPREATASAARDYEFIIDTANRRVRREAKLLYPGGILFHTVAVIDAERGGHQYDALRWRQGTDLAPIEAKEYETFAKVVPTLKVGAPLDFGNPNESVRVTEVRYLTRVDEALFAVPPGYSAAPPPGSPSARELAPGAWLLENMPGGYHAMFVDAGDSVVVLEAPRDDAYTRAALEIIGRTLPGKRVSHVFVTHHHGDHTGGLRGYEGATIIAGKDADVALQRQLKLEAQTVSERTTLRGIDIIPVYSAHAHSSLVFHVRGVVFHGDLFYVPERGPVPPAFPVTDELLAAIAGLDAHTVAGVHGRPATMEEVRLSVRSRRGAPRSR